MPFPTVLYESDKRIATVTLNRPEQRNALDMRMCDDLLSVMAAVQATSAELRVVLFRGAGPVFCAGADLRERDGKGPDWVRERRRRAFAAYDAIAGCALPCIAVVHGPAIGSGCEIAAACDFIIAADAASFRYPEVGWGTVGATQRLPRIVGKQIAKELLFTGRKVTAAEAVHIGLVNRAVPASDLDSTVAELVGAIVEAPPLAMRLAKRCIDLGMETDLQRGIAIEMSAIEEALADKEWSQGVKDFARRRRDEHKDKA
jgi:enoyl-CoA hydratase/carnithine racemase